jgi:hypothetical protein
MGVRGVVGHIDRRIERRWPKLQAERTQGEPRCCRDGPVGHHLRAISANVSFLPNEFATITFERAPSGGVEGLVWTYAGGGKSGLFVSQGSR